MDRHDTLLLASAKRENRQKLRALLADDYNLLETVTPQQTLLLLEQNINCIAAVIADITDMAIMNEALLNSAVTAEARKKVPIIVLAADDSNEVLVNAFDWGAADVIPIHYDSAAMRRRIETIVQLSQHKRNLEILVEVQAEKIRQSNEKMVDFLTDLIEYRSVESGQHILRIRHFTKILLEEVARNCPEYELTDAMIGTISGAASMHDVGKIAIPDSILTKPGKLTAEEWEIMKTHSTVGCRIIDRLKGLAEEDYRRYAYTISLYHHERWDGRGYPEGLEGDAIPISAQVVGLADAYDALTTKRVYKDAYSLDTASNMILNGECGVFSPKLLECFKRVIPQFETLAREYADGRVPEKEDFPAPEMRTAYQTKEDGLAHVRAKYLSLVHYMNIFLMEVDMDRGLFHLVYNPYGDLANFQNIKSAEEFERMMVEEVVIPAEQDKMQRFIREEMPAFLRSGHRRASYSFHLRGVHPGSTVKFEVTLLCMGTDNGRNLLTVIGRKIEPEQTTVAAPPASKYTYICQFDDGFTLSYLSGDVRRLGGYTEEEIHRKFGGRLLDLILPEDREVTRHRIREQMLRSNRGEIEFRIRHKDGRVLWVLNTLNLVLAEDGQEYLYCLMTDISKARQEMEELSVKLQRYEIILSQTENLLFEWDTVRDTMYLSDAWKTMFGTLPANENVSQLMQQGIYFHPDDLPKLMEKLKKLEMGSPYETEESRISTVGGRYIWCRIRASAIRDDQGKLEKIVGLILNIEGEKQEERLLKERAERDSLTKLLNKKAARKRIVEYLGQNPEDADGAMMIIDIDDFKNVNDRYGHLFGDAVLTKVARTIKKLFRTQDIVARIGGDEFLVMMCGTCDRRLVKNRCERLLEAISTTFPESRDAFAVKCSVGVALAPEHGKEYLELFENADRALYQAKAKGKATYQIYDEESESVARIEQKPTTVSLRIDSDEQPGLAENGLVYHAFRKLYTSNDVDAGIQEVLAAIGKLMNVSRVYIFENSPDNSYCSNTYEWCNEGISPQIHKLQNVSYKDVMLDFDENFDEHGIFYCPDVSVLPKRIRDIVEAQEVKSMLHCAIRDKGVFRGYVGFDECMKRRWWTKEQIQILTYFSGILSVFLLKKQEQNRAVQWADNLTTILDNQNAWIYIIDPDTCRMKYLNTKTKELAPDVKIGMRCYEAMMGRDQRCENCPSRMIRQTKTDSTCLQIERFGIRIQAEATLIRWQGEESCLMVCREEEDHR